MSQIKIDILGTTAGVPTAERGHPAIHLAYDDGKEFCCLFDCGEGTQRQLMTARLNLMKIDNVFITHWHGDHCLGLPGMTDTMGFDGRQRPLTVYAPEARRVRKCLDFSRSLARYRITIRNVPARGRTLTTLLKTERFRIVSIPAKHSVPCVAYALMEEDKVSIDMKKAAAFGLPEKGKIYRRLKTDGEIFIDSRRITIEDISVTEKGKKIVYSGDTEICDNLKRLVHRADLLIQDCTYFDEQGPDRQYQHASLPEIIEMAGSGGVKRVILTHISRRYKDAGRLKLLVKDHPGFEVAEDFMSVTI